MNSILKLVANGVDSIADAYVNPRAYIKPSKGGFVLDQNNLRTDVLGVGNDMKKVIQKNGESYRITSSK
jgi:hypothetical protein